MPDEPIHPAMQKLLKGVADRMIVRDQPSGLGTRLREAIGGSSTAANRKFETSNTREASIDRAAIERNNKLAEELRTQYPEAFE
jgi:hypothetical protein